MTARIHDLRLERLARRAPERPLILSEDDRDYIIRQLAEVEEAFGVHAVPDVPLNLLPARAFVRQMADLRANLMPDTLEERLALGRIESVYRMAASAISLMNERPRQSA